LFQGEATLNPLTASVLIPLIVGGISLRYRQWRSLAIGLSLGMAAALSVYTVTDSSLRWLESSGSIGAKGFFGFNAGLCWAWGRYLALPWTVFVAGMVKPWQAETWRSFLQWKGRSKASRSKQSKASRRPR
jgi:Domain of unknown function (DUF5942)